ncbi:response regulator [Halovenus sp. WSH3]|uniref:Response regulator n=1 Tax=Halovenus carboxidivorans TaxID=2692199 RepID=A0A6B0TAD0_9EURY|nr:response regulator [Halovenus carboxidivorans]
MLVVDDEEDVAETYALRLEANYETRIATGGKEALELIDDSVDAVLLDRRMPDMHGDDVLAALRERGYDCPVIMATAVDPDLNILEMDFDDYLCKPIFNETLQNTLEKHLDTGPDEKSELDTFLSLISKIDVLETELTRAELAESEEYERAKQRANELAPRLRERVEDFDELVATYRDIERES